MPGLFGGLLDVARGKLIEVRFDFVEMHDVDILMMQVEKIDLVNQLRAVERTLLDDRDVKSIRIGVHRAGAHASRGAFTAYDETADAEQAEV